MLNVIQPTDWEAGFPGRLGRPAGPAGLSLDLARRGQEIIPRPLGRSVSEKPVRPAPHPVGFKYLVVLLVVILLVGTAGCSPKWRAKFIRKRKGTPTAPQAILVLQPDQKALMPAPDRYREHFAFWKSWHSGLLDSLGQVRKRDNAQLNGAIGELQAMQTLLVGPPANRLREILVELRDLQSDLNSKPATWQIPAATRTRLQKLFREIGRKYPYSNVKDAFAPEPPSPQE
ncbi:MAG: hypothetical protein HYZ88_01380 [Candidatus Omnitrophica bacterium]|nr:hypothetical protein [Candidatus Omnitrophota bacterium]